MTADQRLALIRTKVEKAKQHVDELNAALLAFGKSNPYVVGTKRDPNTRKPIYYVASIGDIPLTLGVIAEEVIQSLRSALDHLAYQFSW